MKIIVQKFGGTSVMNDERRNMAIDKIESAIEKHLNPVVVVSAIGRSGDPYATDTLINLMKSQGVDPDLRELDILMACGEIISATVMVNALKARGHKAAVFTGGQAGIITDANYSNANILRVDPIRLLLSIEEGIIPVITGFQGMTEKGDITTLGRGGSDVTASIIGEALSAELVEIYTDVDGVMTADPKIVPDAKVMDVVYYNEVFQMAEYGAKVLHPNAVEIAMRANIPLVIRNTTSDYNGTLITNYHRTRSHVDKDTQVIGSLNNINNRVQVKVKIKESNPSDLENLYISMAERGISVDMINIFPEMTAFIIHENQLEILEMLMEEIKYDFEIVTNCSKITIIGNRMRGVPGIMAKAISGLLKENINILQTSDSHTTISCLIESKDNAKALNALHRAFELNK